MVELTSFHLPFFPPPEISSFWGTSIAISPSGTQMIIPTLVGRKYSIGSSPLTSFPPMTMTYLLFSIAPPLAFPLLSPLSPYLAPGRCFRSWGSNQLPILLTVPLSSVFCPNKLPLPSTFRKLARMTLPRTLTLTVLLQRNTGLFVFALLLLFLPL